MASCSEFDFGNEVRMLLIGKTGTGKSTTGNTILGEKKFDAMLSAKSVTIKTGCQWADRFNRKIVVVDTPGLRDTSMDDSKIIKEISKWYTLTSPGIHAILLVVKASRVTSEDEETMKAFMELFGDNLKKHLIVVFTDKDQLECSNTPLASYIETIDSSSNLYKLIKKSQERYVALGMKDNETEILKIISMIDEIRGQDGRNYYSNEEFQRIERLMKEREKQQKKGRKDTSEGRDKTRLEIVDEESSSGEILRENALDMMPEKRSKFMEFLHKTFRRR